MQSFAAKKYQPRGGEGAFYDAGNNRLFTNSTSLAPGSYRCPRFFLVVWATSAPVFQSADSSTRAGSVG